MTEYSNILDQIKKAVHLIVPDARVMLFGSRVIGNINTESDWDILVLTKEKFPRNVKWQIHDELFSIGLKHHTYIHLTLTDEHEWENGSGFYSLKRTVADKIISL
jgi:predicted nucleotidyltransferase